MSIEHGVVGPGAGQAAREARIVLHRDVASPQLQFRPFGPVLVQVIAPEAGGHQERIAIDIAQYRVNFATVPLQQTTEGQWRAHITAVDEGADLVVGQVGADAVKGRPVVVRVGDYSNLHGPASISELIFVTWDRRESALPCPR